jgi:AcrR family transcriptional regulator
MPRTARASDAYHHGDLRAALLKVSARLLKEQGVAAFSLREAARIVGVDPAACYRHFRDRTDVLVAIAQEGFAELAERFAAERGLTQTLRPRDVLLHLGDIYVRFAAERTYQFRLMFGESGLPSRDPRLRLPRVEKGPYDQIVELSAAHLEVDVDDPAASNLANLLWAGVHGIARLRTDGALPLTDDEARDLTMSLTEALLGASVKPQNARTKTRTRGSKRHA